MESLKVNKAHIASLLEQTLSFFPHHRWDPYNSFRKEADRKKGVPELEDGTCSYCVQKVIVLFNHVCKSVLILSCSTYFSLVGNLAHNVTRFFLLNRPFFLMISCIFLCSWLSSFLHFEESWKFHQFTNSLYQEFFGVFPISSKTMHRLRKNHVSWSNEHTRIIRQIKKQVQ